MKKFEIILPSNTHHLSYENKIGSYRTKLATTLCFSKEWSVGLSEISYTISWFNIRTDQKVIVCDSTGITYLNKSIIIRAGNYQDIDELLKLINDKVKSRCTPKVSTPPRLTVNKASRIIKIHFGKSSESLPLYMKFEFELCKILGLEELPLEQEPLAEEIAARYTYDLSGGIRSLFLYTDVVEHSLVGDSYTRLLRVVRIPPKSRFGDDITIQYENPHFLKLSKKEFSEIVLCIKDDCGEDVEFKFGRTIVTLQLKENNENGGLLY